MGTLYVIGAPPAAPEDVTLRTVRILRQVSLVVTDEPEQSRRFLARLNLQPRLIPATRSGERPVEALAALDAGDVALLQLERSPSPSGSAARLIQAAVEHGYPTLPIPGPVSSLTSLVLSGLPADCFVYLGSLATQPDLALPACADERCTLVALETADRLPETLARLHAALGERPLVLDGRFAGWSQGMWRGPLGGSLEHVTAHPPQGITTLVIGAGQERLARWGSDRVQSEILTRLQGGQTVAEISRQVAPQAGWSRREVYREALRMQTPQR